MLDSPCINYLLPSTKASTAFHLLIISPDLDMLFVGAAQTSQNDESN